MSIEYELANSWIIDSHVFPQGLPEQFSLVCSFRKRPSKEETWTIIRISDELGAAQ